MTRVHLWQLLRRAAGMGHDSAYYRLIVVGNPGLTDDQARVQMALCLAKSYFDKQRRDVIAINQDELANFGKHLFFFLHLLEEETVTSSWLGCNRRSSTCVNRKSTRLSAMKPPSSLLIHFASTANRCVSFRTLFVHKWRAFKRYQDLDRDRKQYEDELYRVRTAMRISDDLYISPERIEDVMPRKALADQTRRESGAMSMDVLTAHTMMRYLDHSFDNVRRYNEYQHLFHLQYDQRFIPERLLFLGPDLAAAHFLVHRDASVKFIGDDTWYKRSDKQKLPGVRVPGMYLEAIDASGTELLYEGFSNLYDLKHVRMLRLAGCKNVDDWTLSRIGSIFADSLEFLDLSGCQKISAKGLRGLHSLKKLSYLRLEGLDHVDKLAKSALLLEEAIPGLTVLGVNFDLALEDAQKEAKLLEDERVLIDAKGNCHAEDDNGRLFYIHGSINERAAVDDNDKPLVTTTIRREIPAMDDAEFDRLDKLSGGKLRHLLVGSPSGYSWTEQTETILSHEYKKALREKTPVNPKMLPASKRPTLEQSDHDLLEEEEPRQRIEGSK
uniref:ATP synthase subunit s-like protein n=1 Tax=Panagrellus redivivus TaxID=6233 RepID=A0A7E4VU30_PANRE